MRPEQELAQLRRRVAELEAEAGRYVIAEDLDAPGKHEKSIDSQSSFGESDFAELTWLFASTLLNHRWIHQRFDEGGLLWRAVKRTAGPILEIGRATGGTTVCILGASGQRPVHSIDRGPAHSDLAQHVFKRADVRERLTLHTQSSREPIADQQFGLIFIDGDHSYEGVCHDIGRYWNSLTSFNGQPPMAIFHDASENPVAYVPAVKEALDELLAEPGTARRIESQGSMLLVEKLADLDQSVWYQKESTNFLGESGHHFRLPGHIKRTVAVGGAGISHASGNNLLGAAGEDIRHWDATGLGSAPFVQETSDHAARLVVETPDLGEHFLSSRADIDSTEFCVRLYVRPIGGCDLTIELDGQNGQSFSVRFGFYEGAINVADGHGISVRSAEFEYMNGYFHCSLFCTSTQPVGLSTLKIQLTDDSANRRYAGDTQRGFVFNLASVRAVTHTPSADSPGPATRLEQESTSGTRY
tara:strand:+ start:112613 stop:114025 length:1413 start_codon:yes stop_codon:yes gene_type:complete